MFTSLQKKAWEIITIIMIIVVAWKNLYYSMFLANSILRSLEIKVRWNVKSKSLIWQGKVALFRRVSSFRYVSDMQLFQAGRCSAGPGDCSSCGDVLMCGFSQLLCNCQENRCDLLFCSLLLRFRFKRAVVFAFCAGGDAVRLRSLHCVSSSSRSS